RCVHAGGHERIPRNAFAVAEARAIRDRARRRAALHALRRRVEPRRTGRTLCRGQQQVAGAVLHGAELALVEAGVPLPRLRAEVELADELRAEAIRRRLA